MELKIGRICLTICRRHDWHRDYRRLGSVGWRASWRRARNRRRLNGQHGRHDWFANRWHDRLGWARREFGRRLGWSRRPTTLAICSPHNQLAATSNPDCLAICWWHDWLGSCWRRRLGSVGWRASWRHARNWRRLIGQYGGHGRFANRWHDRHASSAREAKANAVASILGTGIPSV